MNSRCVNIPPKAFHSCTWAGLDSFSRDNSPRVQSSNRRGQRELQTPKSYVLNADMASYAARSATARCSSPAQWRITQICSFHCIKNSLQRWVGSWAVSATQQSMKQSRETAPGVLRLPDAGLTLWDTFRMLHTTAIPALVLG